MKFLRSLLAVILVVAIVVPSITVFATNYDITLEQVKTIYPNIKHVDTYYYGDINAYGNVSKEYKCYKITDPYQYLFFKKQGNTEILVQNEKINEALLNTAMMNFYEEDNSPLATALKSVENWKEVVEGDAINRTVNYIGTLLSKVGGILTISKFAGLEMTAKELAKTILEETLDEVANRCINLENLAANFQAELLVQLVKEMNKCAININILNSPTNLLLDKNAKKVIKTTEAGNRFKKYADELELYNKMVVSLWPGYNEVRVTPGKYLNNCIDNWFGGMLDGLTDTNNRAEILKMYADNPAKMQKLLDVAKDMSDYSDCISTVFQMSIGLEDVADFFPSLHTVAKNASLESIYTSYLYSSMSKLPLETVQMKYNQSSSPSLSAKLSAPKITNKSTFTTDENVRLSWSALSGSDYYGITVKNNSTGTTVFNDDIKNNYLDLGKLSAGKYRWQVRGHNGAGWGNLTNLTYFTVEDSNSNTGDTNNDIMSHMKTTYKAALQNAKMTSFDGWCGECVGQQLKVLKINTGHKITPNGNDTYDTYAAMSKTSGGYTISKYPAKNYSLRNALDELDSLSSEYTYAVLGFTTGTNSDAGQKYGHTLLIYAVKDGYVYYTESFVPSSESSECVKRSISKFCNTYSDYSSTSTIEYKYEGMILYSKENADNDTQEPTTGNSSNNGDSSTDLTGWTTTKPSGEYETKEVYVYYHHLVTFSSGNKGAYPINKAQLASNGISCVSEEKHTYWSETPLTKTASDLRYVIGGKLKYFDEYSNSCCGNKYNFSTNANSLYYSEKTTLYKKIEEYTITYNANGGTGAPDKQTQTEGSSLIITTKEPTRDGYEFLGWSTSKSGEVEYEGNDKYTDDKSITLYAVWEEIKTYTIKYDANGGTDAPDSQTKTHGDSIEIADDEPVRTGYNFVGWATSKSGNVKYEAGEDYTDDKSITLFAVWEKIKTYTITYNANGGSDAPKAQTKIHDENFDITDDIPVRNGYEFVGWATSENGSVCYDAGSEYDENESITLFAIWKADTYAVKFNANGGSNAPESQTKVYDENLDINDDEPVRNGYEFVGWATSKDGTAVYYPGGTYELNAGITLYAVWKPLTYTIEYDANGGSGAPEAQTKTYGVELTLSDKKPTRDGYTFIGWSNDASNNTYVSGAMFDENENTTLVALWQEEENETYYIFYSTNGGNNTPDMQTKNKDENIAISKTVPNKNGYKFVCWTDRTTGTEYAPGETYSANSHLNLVAIWEANTYTVSYDANGGQGEPENQTKKHGEVLYITTEQPIRDGFAFVGWSEKSNSKNITYLSGDVFTEDSNTILYAVWVELEDEEEAAEEETPEKQQDNHKFPFDDVPEDAWYRKDVENAHIKGLINGKSERRYAPGDNMTYAEAIKLACTIYQNYYDGIITLTNGEEVWYSTYMDYALENRIVRTDYSSVANEYVTRKEFVNIFYGALPLKEFAKINNVEDNIIPDVKIGDAYSGEIYTFYRAGILTGNDAKGTFKPDSNISRSEVAAIVTRMLDNGARKKIYIK